MPKQINDKTALKRISANVRRLARAGGWSQHELARETGDPVMTINTLFRARHVPRIGLVVRLANALGVSIDDLLKPQRNGRRRKK